MVSLFLSSHVLQGTPLHKAEGMSCPVGLRAMLTVVYLLIGLTLSDRLMLREQLKCVSGKFEGHKVVVSLSN